MEIGIPLTPRSPRPRILEPTDITRDQNRTWESVETRHTIGDYRDSCLTLVFPAIQHLTNPSPVLNGNVLKRDGQ